MATVYRLLPSLEDYIIELQVWYDSAEKLLHKRFLAALRIQCLVRGYLIRRHVAWLTYNALIIQCAFRCFLARKAYRAALRKAVRLKHGRHYAKAARTIQSTWRGYWSRKTKFWYYAYRRWLRAVTERGDRKSAECAEFTLRSRADDLKILEEEARQWLAFVVFKLHHLLRTYNVSGVYSDKATHELSEFEKLIKSIRYTEYMVRLRRKYEEFVKKHRPHFSNKRLFPIIGEGAAYWYLSLPEMYELTLPPAPPPMERRHKATYHGEIHKEPFLWRKVRPPAQMVGRGPFTPPVKPPTVKVPPTPAPTPTPGGDAEPRKDPRFSMYVKYYKPRPDLMEYIDFHINILLRRKCSIEHMELDKKKFTNC